MRRRRFLLLLLILSLLSAPAFVWPETVPSLSTLHTHAAAGTRLDLSSADASALHDTLLAWLNDDPRRLQDLEPLLQAVPDAVALRLRINLLNCDGDASSALISAALDRPYLDRLAETAQCVLSALETLDARLQRARGCSARGPPAMSVYPRMVASGLTRGSRRMS